MLTVEATKEPEPMNASKGYRYPEFSKQIIAIVGGFGSGKTEVAVNLAKFLATAQQSPVTIVDLDLVNPYFRSREAIVELEKLGVRAVAPRGGQFYADLPILLPEVKGVIDNPQGILILDVGGDAQGTRAVGSLSAEFKPGTYEMLMVINSRRPATSNLNTTLNTMSRIEMTAHLEFTGLISNSHLIDETDYEVIKEGYDLAVQVGRMKGIPVNFVSAKRKFLDEIKPSAFKCAVLPLTRLMLKPWERPEN